MQEAWWASELYDGTALEELVASPWGFFSKSPPFFLKLPEIVVVWLVATMKLTAILFALFDLLQALPNGQSQTHLVRELEGRDDPPIIMPLDPNFKKNNVSASWAEGHPKLWGADEKV
jgi:hypothetical protein